MRKLLAACLLVLVAGGAAVLFGLEAAETLAGPGCPDIPGVCPGDYYSDPGHDSGNILA